MRKHEKWEALWELPYILRVNYAGTVLIPEEIIVQMMFRHKQLGLLQEIASRLQIGTNRTFEDYIEAIRTDVVLAWQLYTLVDTADIILHLAEPAWGDFLIVPDDSQRLEGTIPPYFPAIAPVENAAYRLLPVEECPEEAQQVLSWWEKNRTE